MYGEKDKQAKAEEKKHMTFLEAAHVAKDAQVKEMWLTHYSPSLLHPEEYMKSVKKVFQKGLPFFAHMCYNRQKRTIIRFLDKMVNTILSCESFAGRRWRREMYGLTFFAATPLAAETAAE